MMDLTFNAYYRAPDYAETRRVFKQEIDLKTLTKITEGGVNKALKEQPGLLARIGFLVVEAEHFYRQACSKEHCISEDTYLSLKEASKQATTKEDKLSETELKIKVNAHSKMRKAYIDRREKEDRLSRVRMALEAIRERGRVLQTLSANLRAELGTEGRDNK